MTEMLVIDASAAVSIASDVDAHDLEQRLMGASIAAPALLPFDVAHAIRGLRLGAVLTAERARLDLETLESLAIDLWPWSAMAARAWELGDNLTSYDASYVALAELLDVPLITRDARLARAPGIRCPVEVF